MTVTIPSSTWLRGEGPATSMLHRPADGKMCCLGHVLTACGFRKEQLTHVCTPATLINHNGDLREDVPDGLLLQRREWMAALGGEPMTYARNTDLCSRLMTVNDDQNLPDGERKVLVQELLSTIGIEVSFGE